MNACLMKVNFNPKLKIASEVYGTAEKKLKDIKDSREATECSIKSDGKENLKSSIYKTLRESRTFDRDHDKLSNMKLQPLKVPYIPSNEKLVPPEKPAAKFLQSPYSEKLQRPKPGSYKSNFMLFQIPNSKPRKSDSLQDAGVRIKEATQEPKIDAEERKMPLHSLKTASLDVKDDIKVGGSQPRSRTVPVAPHGPVRSLRPRGRTALGLRSSVDALEMERKARLEAERAMKDKKVFTITGPYQGLRQSLRRRGWVERIAPPPVYDLSPRKRTVETSTSAPTTHSQGEDDINNMMSHVVRNCTPAFVFTVRTMDSKTFKSNQVVNHFARSKTFTTKVGLCENIRNCAWYEDVDHESFFPRCYRMDIIEEKEEFIDDYRLCASMGFVQRFVEKYSHLLGDIENDENPAVEEVNGQEVKAGALQFAVERLVDFVKQKENLDIDSATFRPSPDQWHRFLSLYYVDNGSLRPVTAPMVQDCNELLERIKQRYPQFGMQGYQNVWILKPGAKSRGRGIQCLNVLDTILAASANNMIVAQKYIERPFLIHNTKFDIRQWFLVTNWNPLTVWFYKDSYLRFCSQHFTLKDFHPSIHLSNNTVQKNFANAVRSEKLPEDNMWTNDEFENFLTAQGHPTAWQELIVPGMKQAIQASLQCTQEFIEHRKSAFELYGADFMLTEDLHPWLLEINCSPSMARNTKATKKLVDAVLEDTIKVVVDRKESRNADTGRFELCFKQSMVEIPSQESNLTVTGKKIKRKQQTRLR